MTSESKLEKGFVIIIIVIALITTGINISDRQYAKGYNAGYVDGQEDDDYAIERTTNKNYDGGYMDGYETGYDDGFDEGADLENVIIGYRVTNRLNDAKSLFDFITPDTEEESSALLEIENLISDIYDECGW